MKKSILIAILMVFIVSVCGLAHADQRYSDVIYDYPITNITGEALTTVIPTTSIRPNVDKVVGWSIMPSIAGETVSTESFFGIFDSSASNLTDKEMIWEAEPDGGSGGDMWPYGKKILEGVTTRQGTNTILTVYFSRK